MSDYTALMTLGGGFCTSVVIGSSNQVRGGRNSVMGVKWKG